MNLHAYSWMTTEADSAVASDEAAEAIKLAFQDAPLKLVLVYATMNYDLSEVMKILRESFPPEVKIAGCSTQGVMCNGVVDEGGYVLGVMGIGGASLKVATSLQGDIQCDTRTKGEAMAKGVCEALGEDPGLMLVFWDTLCGADIEQVLAGMSDVVGCPIVGGAAAAPFGRMIRTTQLWEDGAFSQSAIVVGISGAFSVEIGMSHGTSPMGLEMTLTRSEGPRLIEIDGKPALQSWRDVTGCADELVLIQDNSVNWAIGVQTRMTESDGTEHIAYFVRASVGFDLSTGTIIVPAAIPQGTKLMFHHRTANDVLSGTELMATELVNRIGSRTPWAVLGFECGARTTPFLGAAATALENQTLRQAVAPNTPWLGMMAWGEVGPAHGIPTAHNYTYPVVVLCA